MDFQEWIQAVCEEIESFKKLGVYEEMAMEKATSTPLPARLTLVTKPNVHGGPARKKARKFSGCFSGNVQGYVDSRRLYCRTPEK